MKFAHALQAHPRTADALADGRLLEKEERDALAACRLHARFDDRGHPRT